MIIRNPQNPILIIKAPALCSISSSKAAEFLSWSRSQLTKPSRKTFHRLVGNKSAADAADVQYKSIQHISIIELLRGSLLMHQTQHKNANRLGHRRDQGTAKLAKLLTPKTLNPVINTKPLELRTLLKP